MRLPILITTMTLALGGAASALSQTFPIDDGDQFPTSVKDLPAHRQQAILTGLKPSLAKIAREDMLNSAEIAEIEKDLLVREVSTTSGTLLIIQGLGSDLCRNAAGGNCRFWVLGDHSRLLLTDKASELTILKSSHHGKPSIVSSLNTSGWNRNVIWYRFNGSRYNASACAIKSYFKRTSGNNPNAPPQIEYRQCSKVLGKYVW